MCLLLDIKMNLRHAWCAHLLQLLVLSTAGMQQSLGSSLLMLSCGVHVRCDHSISVVSATDCPYLPGSEGAQGQAQPEFLLWV